jgi:hypothetical protein
VDRCFAKRLLRIFDEHPMKVHVVDIVKANKGREDIWRKILQDVELSRVSACMHDPCKCIVEVGW